LGVVPARRAIASEIKATQPQTIMMPMQIVIMLATSSRGFRAANQLYGQHGALAVVR
jgi:hypothetical protein